MMPWSLLLNPTVLLGIALAGASGFGYLQTVRLGAAQDRITAVQGRFDVFRTQVASEGKIAALKAAAQAKADLQRAKEADDEAKKRYSSLDAQYAQYRLRQRAGNSVTASLLPTPTAGAPSSPAICYAREQLNNEVTATLGRLRAGLADDAEPYDKAAVVARACKEWATRSP